MLNGTTALAAVHDIGLAAWFGGAWMGAIGLNGATIEVDDHTQRTRVANAGWFRWAPIAGAALLAHVSSAYTLGRLRPTRKDRERGSVGVRRVRTAVTLAAMIATAETGISGQRVVRGGDVPVATATVPIRATPPGVAAAQRRLRVAQWLVPSFTGAIFVLEAIQRQEGALEGVGVRRCVPGRAERQRRLTTGPLRVAAIGPGVRHGRRGRRPVPRPSGAGPR